MMNFYKDLTNKVHVLDSTDFEHLLPQGCVSITFEEAESIRNPAKTPEAIRAALLSQIESLEAANYLTRGARELNMRLLEKEAAEQAEAQGTTVEAVLAAMPYYVKLKALDEQVAALRSQLK